MFKHFPVPRFGKSKSLLLLPILQHSFVRGWKYETITPSFTCAPQIFPSQQSVPSLFYSRTITQRQTEKNDQLLHIISYLFFVTARETKKKIPSSG